MLGTIVRADENEGGPEGTLEGTVPLMQNDVRRSTRPVPQYMSLCHMWGSFWFLESRSLSRYWKDEGIIERSQWQTCRENLNGRM